MRETAHRSHVVGVLVVIGSLALMVLPFITTFDDFLTAVVRSTPAAGALQAVVPVEARMVAVLLSLIGVHAGTAGSELVVSRGSELPQGLFISWNCVGWQSAILFLLSAFAGLRAEAPLAARVQVALLGALGTFFVNLLRITLVCLLAATAGRVPAMVFHDYGGTILVLGWLFLFWMLAYRWLLEPAQRTAS